MRRREYQWQHSRSLVSDSSRIHSVMAEKIIHRATGLRLRSISAVRSQSMIVGLNIGCAILFVVIVSGQFTVLSWRHTALLLVVIFAQQVGVIWMLAPTRRIEARIDQYWRLVHRHSRESQCQSEGTSAEHKLETIVSTQQTSITKVRRLALQLYQRQVEENSRAARLLFDSTAQELAGLLLEISATLSGGAAKVPVKLEGMRQLGSRVLAEVTTLAGRLYPHEMDRNGLAAALRRLGRIHSDGNGIEIDVDVETGDLFVDEDRVWQSILFRIAEEAVRKAVTHGAPRHIQVQLQRLGASHVLEVRDDGRGFDIGNECSTPVGSGLARAIEEAELLGGRVAVRLEPPNGTSVIAVIPCRRIAVVPGEVLSDMGCGASMLAP